MWLNDLELYLLSDSRDSVSLFDHTSGASLTPPATADSATRSQWLTCDTAARLGVCNHLPLAERAHFGQHKTAKALYDAVVAHYSSPTTAALGRLLLPYLFPELSAFATVEDLHLLAAETSVVAVGAARGTPRTPFFEGCSPSHLAPSYTSAAAVDILGAEDVGAASTISGKRRSGKSKGGRSGGGGSGGGGGGGSSGSRGGSGGFDGDGGGSGGGGCSGRSGSGGSRGGAVKRGGSGGGQKQQQQRREWFARRAASWGSFRSPYVIRTGDRAGQRCWKLHSQHRCFFRLNDAWRAELLRYGVDIVAFDYDAILAAMYALSVSAEGDCYRCVPPDLGIEAAARGASESALPGTAPTEALHTFTLESGASRFFFRDSTTLTPLTAPVLVRLADPSEGPVLAHSSTVLPCPAVLSGSLLGLHLPLSLPPLPPSPAPPCLPCVEGWQRAAPHSSFPPTTAPLQTLNMDMWGSARVSGQDRERYFLLVVEDYTCYTTVFPLRSKGEVPDVLIPWIRAFRLQLRERFREDLPVRQPPLPPVRCVLSARQPPLPPLLAPHCAHQKLLVVFHCERQDR
ncbi:unnamed protein product [Closterium sp. NIES-54]